jgi:hypothetical protein
VSEWGCPRHNATAFLVLHVVERGTCRLILRESLVRVAVGPFECRAGCSNLELVCTTTCLSRLQLVVCACFCMVFDARVYEQGRFSSTLIGWTSVTTL